MVGLVNGLGPPLSQQQVRWIAASRRDIYGMRSPTQLLCDDHHALPLGNEAGRASGDQTPVESGAGADGAAGSTTPTSPSSDAADTPTATPTSGGSPRPRSAGDRSVGILRRAIDHRVLAGV